MWYPDIHRYLDTFFRTASTAEKITTIIRELYTMNRHSVFTALALVAVLAVGITGGFAADNKPPVEATPPQAEPVAVKLVPPRIIISTRPAFLVTVDGPPVYTLVKGTEKLLWRVVNTRVLLLKNAKGRHFLHFHDGFLEAPSLTGPWFVANKVPTGVKQAETTARAARKTDLLEGKPDPKTRKKPSLKKAVIPFVYLTTTPAELVITDGEADFISIEGTRLFYARNTAGNIFWHQGDHKVYLLVSGLWLRAETLNGPWEYVPATELPGDFAAIPEESPKAQVKAAVPVNPSNWLDR